jgi:hypothetical protein
MNQLKTMLASGLGDLFDLEYIPWGNARMGEDGLPECQHGRRECDLNRLLACAQEAYPERARWFSYLLCVEEAAFSEEGPKLSSLEVCMACMPLGW